MPEEQAEQSTFNYRVRVGANRWVEVLKVAEIKFHRNGSISFHRPTGSLLCAWPRGEWSEIEAQSAWDGYGCGYNELKRGRKA